MTRDQWSRIAPILHSALMREGHGRAAFVAQACGGDEEVRREVESLLQGASDIDRFLDNAAGNPATDAHGPSLPVGDRVGPYVIEGRLGAGGMGEVYRARHSELSRSVAIKILPEAFTGDAERVARFDREARILAALNHPRIGAIYGLEHRDGVPALILELVEGPTLADRLAGGPLSVAVATDIAIQVAEALEAAHDRGIVHRDIKPANIKFTPAGGVKVLDFGLAKDIQRHGDGEHPVRAAWPAARPDMSIAGSVLGTIAYMSPEQAAGEEIDARTDLFSLGAVLYEMVTGRPAFTGPEPLPIADVSGDRMPVAPRFANPTVPRDLERVIVRLLEPSRDARYQTASALRADLMRAHRNVDASGPARAISARRRRRTAAVAAAVAALAAVGAWSSYRAHPNASARTEYAQVTYFADSATSPALSPDGRLLTFVRGESTFKGPGQVYLKELPDGDPVQLTSDSDEKMSPVFSPDGSRIAYTSVSGEFKWDTWVIPLAARKPRLWLANASGLTWSPDGNVLFSGIAAGLHMHVVSADLGGKQARVIYSPAREEGMAHRSYASPDGAWVLIAEMVRPSWQRCRLVATDGRSNRLVGPDGPCTAAAWSPDGAWMYFSSNVAGSFHIWRQRFPDGTPEQITGGPGEEEGIAMSPDGGSLLTSVGNRQSSVWVRDASGERELSREGYAFIPGIPNAGTVQPFSTNHRLLYLVRRGADQFAGPVEHAGELWQTDLETSRSELLFPGFRVSGYDVSRDGARLVFAALDEHATSHIWLARLDQPTAPRQLIAREADSPRFGAGGSIYYRSSERGGTYIYRLAADGTSRKAAARPVVFFLSVAPDDAWLIARVEAAPGTDSSQENVAFPTTGGPPVRLCAMNCEIDWTPSGQSVVVRLGASDAPAAARTFVIRLRAGESLPRFPLHGIRSQEDLAGLRVSQALPGFVYPDDVGPLVALVRGAVQRNIYRVGWR